MRFVANISRNRAVVTEEVLRKYIENSSDDIKDIPIENIWNHDETNLTDDPKKVKAIS